MFHTPPKLCVSGEFVHGEVFVQRNPGGLGGVAIGFKMREGSWRLLTS